MSGAFHKVDATVSARQGVAVTPSDSTVIPVTRALYIGGTGNLNVRMTDGVNVLFTAIPAGFAPLQVDQVLATGTTATNIVALG
jgi:hypothetical protein